VLLKGNLLLYYIILLLGSNFSTDVEYQCFSWLSSLPQTNAGIVGLPEILIWWLPSSLLPLAIYWSSYHSTI